MDATAFLALVLKPRVDCSDIFTENPLIPKLSLFRTNVLRSYVFEQLFKLAYIFVPFGFDA